MPILSPTRDETILYRLVVDFEGPPIWNLPNPQILDKQVPFSS